MLYSNENYIYCKNWEGFFYVLGKEKRSGIILFYFPDGKILLKNGVNPPLSRCDRHQT